MHLLEINMTLDLHDRHLELNLPQHHATSEIVLKSQHHLARAMAEMVILRTLLGLLQGLEVTVTMGTTTRLPVVHLEVGTKATSSLHQAAPLCPCRHIIARLHHLQ